MLDVIQQRLRTPRNFTDKKTGAKTQLSLLRSNASFFKLSTDQHDGWIKALHLLKDKCQVEDWGDSAAGLPVLNNYLTQLFAAVINRYLEYHQADEDFKIKSIDPEYDAGIFFSDNDQYMSFNTGLYTNNFKKIFGHFTRNFHKNQQPWYFQGWMTDYEISYINGASLYRKKPMPFVFAKELHELYFNPFIQLNIDPEHILKDPGNLNQVQAVLQELNIVNCSKSELIQRLTGAVAMMVVRVQQNSRTVMPQYSAQTGVIQLLLPLSFTVDHTVQLVIPVSKEPLPRAQGVQADDWDPAQWQYIGRSVLATDVAYNNARLLNRIESEWLHLGRGSSADGLMSSSASLLSAGQRLHNAQQTASSAIPTVLSAPPNLVQLTHREKANQIKQICAVEATDDLSTLSEHSAAHTTEKVPEMQQQRREAQVKLKQHGSRQAHPAHPAHQHASGHSTDERADGPNKLPHQQHQHQQLQKNGKHHSEGQNLRGPHQQLHKEGPRDQQLHGSNKRDGKNHNSVSQLLHVPTEVWHSRHEDKKEARDGEEAMRSNETSRQQHRELELPSSNVAVLSAGGPSPVSHQVTASQQLLTAMTQHKTHTNSESIPSAPAPAPTTPVTPVSVEKKQADAELARRANSLNPNHPTYMGHEAKARYLKEHPNLPNSKETRETKFKAGGHVFEKNKPQHQQPEDGRLDKPHHVSTSGSNIAVLPKTESVNAEPHAPELIAVLPITPHSASPQSVPSQIVTPRSPPPLLPAGTRPGVHSGASRHPSVTVSSGDVRTTNLADSSPIDQRGDSHSAQQQQQSEAVSSSSAHNSPKNHKARKGNRRDIDNVSLDSAEFPPVQSAGAVTRAAAPHQTNNTSAKTMPKHGGGGHWDRQKGSARNNNGENKIAQNAMRAITQQQQTPPLTQQTSQQQGHTATDKK